MSNIYTGINIGEFCIEVVQIKKTLAGYCLLKHGRADIPAEKEGADEYGIEQGGRAELQSSRSAGVLRRVLEENSIEPINVVASIPDSMIILRYFPMPSLPQKELESAVRFEAQKYIPFKMEEVASDFFIIDTKEKKKELRIVFIATKKETLGYYRSIFRDASVDLIAIENPSLALMRLFRSLNLLAKKDLTAILYVEKTDAVLTVCDYNMPYLMRDFSLTSPPKTPQLPETEFGQKAGVDSAYESLLREIQLSFDYHYRHLPAMRIDKLIILGRNGLERWREYLERDLKMFTMVGNPNLLFKGQAELESAMSVAVGLALREFQPREKRIDLLVKEALPVEKETLEQKKPFLMRVAVLELALGLSIMLSVNLTMLRQTRLINNYLTEVKKLRGKIGALFSNASKEELVKIHKELIKKQNILFRITDKRVLLTLQLSELPRVLPAGVWLENLQIESKTDGSSGARNVKLIIEGRVFAANQRKSEPELVNELISNIKNSPIIMGEFNKVELGFMEKGTESGFSVTRFKVVCSS